MKPKKKLEVTTPKPLPVASIREKVDVKPPLTRQEILVATAHAVFRRKEEAYREKVERVTDAQAAYDEMARNLARSILQDGNLMANLVKEADVTCIHWCDDPYASVEVKVEVKESDFSTLKAARMNLEKARTDCGPAPVYDDIYKALRNAQGERVARMLTDPALVTALADAGERALATVIPSPKDVRV